MQVSPDPPTQSELIGSVPLREYHRLALSQLEKQMESRFEKNDEVRASTLELLELRSAQEEKYLENRLQRLEAGFDDRLTSIQLAIKTALETSERAIEKAESSTDKRFEHVTVSIGQRIADQASHENKYIESRLVRLEAAFDDRLAAMEIATRTSMDASEKAILKAEASTDKRFDSVNEFRGMLNDLVTTLMPRSEVLNRFESMQLAITNCTDRLNVLAGAGQGLRSGWLVLVGGIGLVATISALSLRSASGTN